MSMSTRPNTCFFASATKRLPGPTILSTFGTDSVPNASAATACAPPTLKTRPTPATLAAARMAGLTLPSAEGGVTITISPQPASTAGMQFISTDDGYAAVPPGTYRPTFSSGSTRWPRITPSLSWTVKPFSI